MPDTTAPTQTGPAKIGAGGIVIDPAKSATDYMSEAEKNFIVPRLVREKFPELVKLIYETESMDEEEREYWMQILPIMSEEQIVKLKDILNNEKEQLKQLGGEYKGFKPISAPPIDEKSRKERISNIQQKEQSQEEKEEAEEEKLLKKMQEL